MRNKIKRLKEVFSKKELSENYNIQRKSKIIGLVVLNLPSELS